MGKNKTVSLETESIIKKILCFLQLFMCETLAKRIMSMVLISVGLPNKRITELTGYGDKSVRVLKKALASGEVSDLFHVGGGGKHRKLKDVEEAIVEEVNNNTYHSQQQIVDMVNEKFGIKVSVDTIRRLLKKRVLSA